MTPRLLPAALLLAGLALAQTPVPKLVNSGAPMRVPFQCSDDDMQTFGLACPPQQPCAVYLELAGVDSSASRLFLSGNLHTETATLYSILLASDDGGKTWQEAHPRLRAGALDQMQFFDLENGWIAGQQLAPLPHDPFLLITRDGGKTWRQQPVYPEGSPGLLEYFHFDARAHGLLWTKTGGRYELLETSTGGDVWTIKESSDKPIPGKQRAVPAGYRLRPDASSKSYRVERQEDSRWAPLASFSVRAGECKEREPSFDQPGSETLTR